MNMRPDTAAATNAAGRRIPSRHGVAADVSPDGPTCEERGSLTVELVLLTPLLLAFLMLVVGLGRLAETRGLVDGAARDAARAASLARSTVAATEAAQHAAKVDLAGAGLHCATLTISTDTTRFQPGGQVRVTVACTADLAALTGIGLPARKTLSATSAAPLETYRGVGP